MKDCPPKPIMKNKRYQHLILCTDKARSLRWPVLFLAGLMILLTNGFRPNYQQKIHNDCMAKMFRINRILNTSQNSSSTEHILGNGESIASYPRVLQLCGEGSPVCPLLENQASEFSYYSVIKASDSFEVRCFFHGTRSDYEAGKEIIVTEQQLQLVQQLVNKNKLSLFAEILLINLLVAVFLWLPAILMYGKPQKFVPTFRKTLAIHRTVLIVLLIAWLPAFIMASTIDEKAVISTTVVFALVAFIGAKAFEMAYLPVK